MYFEIFDHYKELQSLKFLFLLEPMKLLPFLLFSFFLSCEDSLNSKQESEIRGGKLGVPGEPDGSPLFWEMV